MRILAQEVTSRGPPQVRWPGRMKADGAIRQHAGGPAVRGRGDKLDPLRLGLGSILGRPSSRSALPALRGLGGRGAFLELSPPRAFLFNNSCCWCPGVCPKEAEMDEKVKLTPELILLGQSSRGMFSNRQLALLGEPVGPGMTTPMKGWRRRLVGKLVPKASFDEFVRLKDAHLSAKQLAACSIFH